MTGNYEIIQKIVKFRSIRKMGALHVNYLQKKIQNGFGWIYDTYGYMYIIWIYDTYEYMYIWIYDTLYILNALYGQNH